MSSLLPLPSVMNVFVKCGTQNCVHYIDIGKLGASLGADVCEALLGMHAFTGCDSVSAFGGRGKLNGLKIMIKDVQCRKAMVALGQDWALSKEQFTMLQEFTCRLYAAGTKIRDVNELQYQLFRAKKGEIDSSQLPPSEDCLQQHSLHANYQPAVWRKSLEQNPNMPSPELGHGWVLDDDPLVVEWMTGPPAPEVVLEFMAGKCSKACTLPQCQCITNGFKCSPACRLQTCANMPDEENEEVTLQSDEVQMTKVYVAHMIS